MIQQCLFRKTSSCLFNHSQLVRFVVSRKTPIALSCLNKCFVAQEVSLHLYRSCLVIHEGLNYCSQHHLQKEGRNTASHVAARRDSQQLCVLRLCQITCQTSHRTGICIATKENTVSCFIVVTVVFDRSFRCRNRSGPGDERHLLLHRGCSRLRNPERGPTSRRATVTSQEFEIS